MMECEEHGSGKGNGGWWGTLGVFVHVLIVGLVVILVGVVVLLVFRSRFASVKYHRYMMDRAGQVLTAGSFKRSDLAVSQGAPIPSRS